MNNHAASGVPNHHKLFVRVGFGISQDVCCHLNSNRIATLSKFFVVESSNVCLLINVIPSLTTFWYVVGCIVNGHHLHVFTLVSAKCHLCSRYNSFAADNLW